MSRFPPEHRLTRVRIGEVAYLRVRVIEGIVEPWNKPPSGAAVVALIDKAGQAIDERSYIVPESGIVTQAEAFKAVKEALR